jgi:hypothetical protein
MTVSELSPPSGISGPDPLVRVKLRATTMGAFPSNLRRTTLKCKDGALGVGRCSKTSFHRSFSFQLIPIVHGTP